MSLQTVLTVVQTAATVWSVWIAYKATRLTLLAFREEASREAREVRRAEIDRTFRTPVSSAIERVGRTVTQEVIDCVTAFEQDASQADDQLRRTFHTVQRCVDELRTEILVASTSANAPELSESVLRSIERAEESLYTLLEHLPAGSISVFEAMRETKLKFADISRTVAIACAATRRAPNVRLPDR